MDCAWMCAEVARCEGKRRSAPKNAEERVYGTQIKPVFAPDGLVQ